MSKRYIFGLIVLSVSGLGVFFGFRYWSNSGFLASSAVTSTGLNTMNETQLQTYITQQEAALSGVNDIVSRYQENIDAAKRLLDTMRSRICTNGMSNFPACNSGICIDGYRLQDGICVADCSVVYTHSQSRGDITQENTNIDFVFTNTSLYEQYSSQANNIRFVYDTEKRYITGKFDISNTTYTCRPFIIQTDKDAPIAPVCDTQSERVVSCGEKGTLYSVDFSCDKTSYTYILNKCSSSATPLVLNGTLSPVKPTTNQPVTFTVTPAGGEGTYTYVWSGTDGLTSTTSTATKIYTTAGTKTANVTVTSAGQSETLTLTALVAPSLTVSIRATSPTGSTILQKGQNATLTATVSGGTAPYTYSWSGSESLSGTTASIKKLYTTAGSKTVTVTVTSADGKRGEYTMNVNVIEPPLPQPPVLPLSVACNPLIDKNGRTVTWSARVSGGPNTTYVYKWSLNGESGVPRSTMTQSTNASISRTYVTGGTKTAIVEVKSGAQTITRSCTVNLPAILPR